MRAYASWPEYALSPIGGAESRCPLLSAIRRLRRGKFDQGVSSVKNGVKVSGIGSYVLAGNSNSP
jgi:hypothetical protein